ncbi:RhoGAP domain-containing protein [Zalerion maritima]|uniref:RhoGAP domain-containing protein n=1 Tax=Zalerion maritima TaxID=339359 RepID=A0AAD5RRL7_9PEZI|nr:RhoGAP domain-containing protein [Zalerion maritima]
MMRPANLDPLGTRSHPASSSPLTLIPYKRRPLSRASLANIRDHLCSSLGRANDLDTRAIRIGDPNTQEEEKTPADSDVVEDRDSLVKEYNRLARKHGIRTLQTTQSQQSPPKETGTIRRSWFPRTLFGQSWPNRKPSSQEYKATHHEKRSLSDLTLQLKVSKRDTLKGHHLDGLVRLCGRSMLYLPEEYAPGELSLPTCLRAPAQYLVAHAADRGLFRIAGSLKNVNLLYDYYAFEDRSEVAETTRQPNLPIHINYEVHDVASLFKRILSGLPGGILGSLALFDALIAIHSQLHDTPHSSQSTQCKIRARLIALAIGAVESQFQRELVCAVFGLLALLGKAAGPPLEERGQQPSPKHQNEVMGYEALGIVFGPLLIGDLISTHTMKLADPSAGLVLYPATPPRSRKERMRKIRQDRHHSGHTIDKIHVANNIAEMLISNWREAVKHMKCLKILKPDAERERRWATPTKVIRPSASMDFEFHKRPSWEIQPTAIRLTDARASPIHPSPTPPHGRYSRITPSGSRSVSRRPSSVQKLGIKTSFSTLSPTAEEPGEGKSVVSSKIPRPFKLGKHSRWSTVSLGSVQERSTHPALRDTPSKCTQDGETLLPSPGSQTMREKRHTLADIHPDLERSDDFENDGLQDKYETRSSKQPADSMSTVPLNSGGSSQEMSTIMSAARGKGPAPRKITGLTRGPGSVKKLAAMFEDVSKNQAEENGSPLRGPTSMRSHILPSVCMVPGESKIANIGSIVQCCHTDPPIARQVRRPRPLSMPHADKMPPGTHELPPGSPCSNAALHAQVRMLQRELDTKADEVLRLRRQAETMHGGDMRQVATRLRDAEESASA